MKQPYSRPQLTRMVNLGWPPRDPRTGRFCKVSELPSECVVISEPPLGPVVLRRGGAA